MGSRVGMMYADFQVVDLTTHCYFSKYFTSGYIGRKQEENNWYFKSNKSTLKSAFHKIHQLLNIKGLGYIVVQVYRKQ